MVITQDNTQSLKSKVDWSKEKDKETHGNSRSEIVFLMGQMSNTMSQTTGSTSKIKITTINTDSIVQDDGAENQ